MNGPAHDAARSAALILGCLLTTACFRQRPLAPATGEGRGVVPLADDGDRPTTGPAGRSTAAGGPPAARPAADGAAPPPFDLAACQALALRIHPALQVAERDLAVARAELGEAEAARWPTLGLRGSLDYAREPDLSAPAESSDSGISAGGSPASRFYANLSAAQRAEEDREGPDPVLAAGGDLVARYSLYDGGERGAAIAAARARALARAASRRERRDAILVAVTEAYLDAVSAAAALVARRQDEAWRDRLLARSRARRRVGRATTAEVATAAAERAAAVRDRRQAVALARQAEGSLNEAMGRSADASLRLAGLNNINADSNADTSADTSADTNAETPLADLTRLLREAAGRHPRLARALAEIDRRRAEAAAIGAGARPRVDLDAAWGLRARNPAGGGTRSDDTWSLGAELSWPLFTGFAQSRREERARALSARAAAERDEAVVQVAARIWRAWWQAHAGGAAVDAARAAVERAREERRRIAGLADHGAATAVERLGAAAALARAEEHLVRARAAYRRARVRVLVEAGLDPRGGPSTPVRAEARP